ncbi:hypothetical protein Emed_005762 [Eimeria media]
MMDSIPKESDTSEYPLSTTHVGGQDATTRQIVIVSSRTLACVSNSRLLLYKLEGDQEGSHTKGEGNVFGRPEESLDISDPVSLHPPKSEGHTFTDDRGISAVAVDEDHQLIAVCGRSVGKPASIYIYSTESFALLRRCRALGEQGFSVAAFRGKFSLDTKSNGNQNKYSKTTNASSGVPSTGEEPALNAGELEELANHLGTNVDPRADVSQTKPSSFAIDEDELDEGVITDEQLCNPEQVPLLAVIGWEGDGGEAGSLGSQYLSLWNIQDGKAFLRLKTPALQVTSLRWYAVHKKAVFVPLERRSSALHFKCIYLKMLTSAECTELL